MKGKRRGGLEKLKPANQEAEHQETSSMNTTV